MKVLITGVAGLLGANFSRYLLQKGHEVIGGDDLSGGYEENVPKECHFYIQETFNNIYQSEDSSHISISGINQLESYKYMSKNNYIIGGSYVQSNIFDNSES